jgi:hypothetical protein
MSPAACGEDKSYSTDNVLYHACSGRLQLDNFKRVFQFLADHTLSQTNFRSTGGSQYDKWMNTSIRSLATTSGWRKLDPAGNVPTVRQSGFKCYKTALQPIFWDLSAA